MNEKEASKVMAMIMAFFTLDVGSVVIFIYHDEVFRDDRAACKRVWRIGRGAAEEIRKAAG